MFPKLNNPNLAPGGVISHDISSEDIYNILYLQFYINMNILYQKWFWLDHD